ncbi:MAG: hypothetical protein JXB88_18485 [Spirochaetales bacterium]|nr:hypothetical protein [Spirochaetales bacterium]
MKGRKISITFFICIIYLSLSMYVSSTEGEFLTQLKINLHTYGWLEEEIIPFMQAAQRMNWESVENNYADIVAYSLQYCKKCRMTTTSEEKTELAYHLAIAASEMKAIGFEEDVIVRVAVNTSREFVGALKQYRKKGNADGLGEMIRERIREQVCNEGTEAQRSLIMERIRNRTGTNSNQKEKQGQQLHGGEGHGPH